MKAPESARLFVEPPFVGRGAELGLLERACEDALDGRGGVVLVAGEAGIGKTRTVSEAARVASDFTVLWGRCRAMEGAPPYWPWTQIAGAMRSGGSEGMAALFDSVAAFPAGPGRAGGPRAGSAGGSGGVAAEADPAQWRFRFFDSVASVLRQASEKAPLLLLIEDLHWADSESLQLASFVADEIRDRRVLLVGTHRPVATAVPGSTRAVFSQLLPKARRVDLAPLGRADVDQVVAACVGELPRDIVDQIFKLTEGNPFFLRELAGLFAGGRDPSTVRLPEHIRETVQQRLALLPAEPRRLLGIAAVAGREFDPALVAAVAGCEARAVREALDIAAEHGVVVEAGRRRLRFAHALIQAVLYADEPRTSRAGIHRRLAEELSTADGRDGEGRDDAIAHHYFACGDDDGLEKGAEAALRAGDRARAALGYEAAARHYERVLEVQAAAGVPAERRLPVAMACGEALWCANDFEGARARFLEAMQMGRQVGSARALGEAALGLATTLSPAGPGVADPALISALEEAGRALVGEESSLHATVLSRLAVALYYTPHFERRLALAEAAIGMARRCGDAEALAVTLLHAHRVMLGAASLEDRRRVALEAFEAASSVANDELTCEARLARVQDELEDGDLVAATRELESASVAADAGGLLRQKWAVLRARATLAMTAGRFEEAERLAAATLEVPALGRTRDAQQFFGGQMAQIRRIQGRLDELLPIVSAMVENNPTMPVWRCAVALAELQAGHRDEARAGLESLSPGGLETISRHDLNWGTILASVAELSFELGDPYRGAQVARWLEDRPGTLILLNVMVGGVGPVRLFLGMARYAAGDRDGAVEALEEALAEADRLGALPFKVRAQLALARVLTETGGAEERMRARALLDVALATAVAIGMSGFVRRIEEAARSTKTATRGPVEMEPSERFSVVVPAAPAQESIAEGAEGAEGGDGEGTVAAGLSPAGPASGVVPVRRSAVLRRQGEFWLIACGDEAVHIKHRKGLDYLRILLLEPNRDRHALELAGLGDAGGERDLGEALDDTARDAYRSRLRDLREDLDEARENNDSGRAALAQSEIEALEAELRRAFGLGGRARPQGGAGEKARINVTRAIAGVVRAIEKDCPVLGRHLASAVRTRTTCCYSPDPGFPLDWSL